MRYITLPSFGGSDDDHWQSHWERESPAFRRFSAASWAAPDFEDWSAALGLGLSPTNRRARGRAQPRLPAGGALGPPTHPRRAEAVPRLAPPDPAGARFPPGGKVSFASGLTFARRPRALLITSDDDPYCSPSRSTVFADRLAGSTRSRSGAAATSTRPAGWAPGGRVDVLTAFAAGLGKPMSVVRGSLEVPKKIPKHYM